MPINAMAFALNSMPQNYLFPRAHSSDQSITKKVLEHNTPIPSSVKAIGDIDKYIRRNSKRILFTKQSGWREENEYRVVSADEDFLDISGAITAVYLTSFKSTECLLTEKLNGTVPVKFLHYIGAFDNLSLPVLTDTKRIRKQQENELMSLDKFEAEAKRKEQRAMDILKSYKQ